MAKSWEKTEARKTLEIMVKAHPATFFPKDSPDTRPLKLGIAEDIIAEHPELKPGAVRRFLAIYCNKQRYLTAIAAGRPRVGLDGVEVGPVTEANIGYANRVLAQREVERAARDAAAA